MPRMPLSILCYLQVEEGYGGFTYNPRALHQTRRTTPQNQENSLTLC